MRDLGKVVISDDGKVMINPLIYPDAQPDDKIIIYSRDGELYAIALEVNENIDSLPASDPKINLTISTKNQPAIGVKKIIKYGNSQHIVINKTMMDVADLEIGDLAYVYILKVEGERDG